MTEFEEAARKLYDQRKFFDLGQLALNIVGIPRVAGPPITAKGWQAVVKAAYPRVQSDYTIPVRSDSFTDRFVGEPDSFGSRFGTQDQRLKQMSPAELFALLRSGSPYP